MGTLAHPSFGEQKRSGFALPIPTQLDRFEVLGAIGTGGMSTVYLARAKGPGGFEKRIAIKVLKPRLARNPEMVRCFFHEGRVGALLSHPHLVQTLELGQWQGTYYLVLEYFQSTTLGTVLDAVGALPPSFSVHIATAVCQALHAVHEAPDRFGEPLNLLHLDVSPENVLISRSGMVKLIDFGIAQSRFQPWTGKGIGPGGKLPYMSPERVQGEEPRPSADVFSVGVMLWEMLAGQSLFAGDNALQTAYRVVHAPIADIGELCPNVPKPLAQVVSQALCRDASVRYQSAWELLVDLRAVAAELGEDLEEELVPEAMESVAPPEMAA